MLEAPRTALRMALFLISIATPIRVPSDELVRIEYRQPGLVVDLGVGLWAWPLPMDFDRDGDLDLVVSCPDKPYRGVWFFENPSGRVRFPVFRPGVRISDTIENAQVSFVGGEPIVLTPGRVHPEFRPHGLARPSPLPGTAAIALPSGKIRANQWRYFDYEGDLAIGIGHWDDYGWDDAWDPAGRWTRGPLHGWVYIAENRGTNAAPQYAEIVKLEAGGRPIDVFGMPSPNFADFDADGDLDLVCGEFLDRLTYFENSGTRTAPRYEAGRFLEHRGETIRMELQMIVPVAIDQDFDGDVDLVVGEEDGRVALLENTGALDPRGVPAFLPPRHFEQEAHEVKFGALVTPDAVDWDGDGDEDIVCGNTAGFIAFLENVDGGDPPRFAPPRRLEAGGETIRIQAGPNGSIQGPCEAKWGYTTVSVADWDQDGLPDLMTNGIWGKIEWYRNAGTRHRPRLEAARPIEVAWDGAPPKPAWNWWNPEGRALVTQWRTRPVPIDWTGDGLTDLVVLDPEGYLALFERRRSENGELVLAPGRRVFLGADGEPLLWSRGRAGKSGRRKIAIVDWDVDGRLDILADSVNADFWRQTASRDGAWIFENQGLLDDRALAGHTTSPDAVDWNRDGVPDLLIGAEDGYLYYKRNHRAPRAAADDAGSPRDER
jgi:hypothetical protein